jgi:HPr kinase/phosphorylase
VSGSGGSARYAQPVKVARFFEAAQAQLDIQLIAGKAGLSRQIVEGAINRPGFALAGFFQYFAFRRVQVLGFAEHAYLSSLTAAEREERLRAFFARRIPCVVVTRHKKMLPEMVRLSEEFRTPLFHSRMITMDFVNAATIIMENLMAPHVKVQGTMVEIMGIGVLIEGKPGSGKSETALGLIRRGSAALVSDDITAMRLDSAGNVIAAPVNVTRYHMEIRGIGIIHVPSLFGVASVREEKKLDLIASLIDPKELEQLDRSGQVRPSRVILGVEIPQVMVGVAPGRDLVNIIETAALDQKLRRLGHDAAKELDERLVALMTEGKAGSE